MTKFYSVDRRGMCAPGRQLTLQPNAAANGNDILAHINDMHPNGFSAHGGQHFRDAHQWPLESPEYRSGILELLLEATRKAHYPSKPSRYQSMFAWDSLEVAAHFKASNGHPSYGIYELLPQARVHRGDMSIYTFGPTFAGVDHRLHLYWQGKTLEIPGYEPRWEHVIELPLLVGNKVG
ncbi:hypothetical protein [Cupriavidus necator]